MNSSALIAFGTQLLKAKNIDSEKKDKAFSDRFLQHLPSIESLFDSIYGYQIGRNESFNALLDSLIENYQQRSNTLLKKDKAKAEKATGT